MGKVTATATNVNVNTLADRKSEYYRVKLNPNKRCKESSGAQAAPERRRNFFVCKFGGFKLRAGFGVSC